MRSQDRALHSSASRGKNCYMGGQLDELLASLAARCRTFTAIALHVLYSVIARTR